MKEQPKENLTNWRPISLINADYNITSKALVLRIKKTLPHTIRNNQTDFVKGRNISTTIRQIDDIIIHESNKETPSIVLSLDCPKAFDTLSTSLILEALDKFGFDKNLKSWIKILVTDRQGNVKNAGIYSEYFYPERGVRQGCPISPMLFIMAVEMLAISIRQDNNILAELK